LTTESVARVCECVCVGRSSACRWACVLVVTKNKEWFVRESSTIQVYQSPYQGCACVCECLSSPQPTPRYALVSTLFRTWLEDRNMSKLCKYHPTTFLVVPVSPRAHNESQAIFLCKYTFPSTTESWPIYLVLPTRHLQMGQKNAKLKIQEHTILAVRTIRSAV
jgi:hypothetical protein